MKSPARRLSLSLAMLISLAVGAFAEYLPVGADAAAGARHIVLIYDGASWHRDWQQADFLPLLAYTDPAGVPRSRFFDTLLFLMLQADSGHAFCPGFGDLPADKADWDAYISNRLFGGDAHLLRLNAAAGEAAAALGLPGLRWKVILTIPYPDPAQRNFGSLALGQPSLDLAYAADRHAAVKWYVTTVANRWHAAGLDNLQFVGWYWLQEEAGGADAALLPLVSQAVHAQGRRFFWIPWFEAPGSDRWQNLGFDAALHQPNFFFSTEVPLSRLHIASEYAKQYGLGVEVEMDERALSDPVYRARYESYLAAGQTEGFRDGALTAWYMGKDALLTAARSTDPAQRAVYDETYDFVFRSGLPGDANGNNVLDLQDAVQILRLAAGRDATYTTRSAAAMDIVPDGRITLQDASAVVRTLNGLGY